MVKDDAIRITMVQRAIDILKHLEEMPGAVGVSDMASHLDLPKATVHRILTTTCLLLRPSHSGLPFMR